MKKSGLKGVHSQLWQFLKPESRYLGELGLKSALLRVHLNRRVSRVKFKWKTITEAL